jgi:hypothetical protein
MKTAFSLLLLCLLIFVSHANETKPSEEVQIRYCKAVEVYKMLGETFPEVDGIVNLIDLHRNCLVLNMNHPDASKVREVIQTLDTAPTVIRLETVVSLISADGREKVLTRPTYYTLSGRTVEFQVAEYDGVHLKVTVTPTIE